MSVVVLGSHLGRAKENGVIETELIEAITHLAFYAGRPKAMTAITAARQVFCLSAGGRSGQGSFLPGPHSGLALRNVLGEQVGHLPGHRLFGRPAARLKGTVVPADRSP
ncbi:carboxymuconolactone decarboxylase family protein [Streptomyces antimycoticus]